MKTMLGPKYDGQVAEENRFHPSMLSNFLKSLKVSNTVTTVTSEKHFTTRNIFLPCPVPSLGKNGFACGFDEHFSLLWPQWHWKGRHKIYEASVQRVRFDLLSFICLHKWWLIHSCSKTSVALFLSAMENARHKRWLQSSSDSVNTSSRRTLQNW